MRGKTIPYCSKRKKQRIEQERILEGKITSLENEFQIKPTTMILTELEKTKQELEELRIPIINAIMMRSKARWVTWRKTNQVFLQSGETKFYIKDNWFIRIRWKIDNRPKEMISAQADFYQKLYQTRNLVQNQEELDAFLKTENICELQDEDKLECDKPISLSELAFCIKNIPNMKSPGPDGFPIEFYKFFSSAFCFEELFTSLP